MYNRLLKMLINMNIYLHIYEDKFYYHIKHCWLMEKFMNIIASKDTSFNYNRELLPIIAWSHDLLKDREDKFSKFYKENKNNLKRFHLTEEMYKSISPHGYRAAEFLSNYPFNITDGKILFSVLFHSVPIIDVIENILTESTRKYVDLTLLCDKLSSNYLRIHEGEKVLADIGKEVFGDNYDKLDIYRGLYIIRLFAKIIDKKNNEYDKQATEYYRKKWNEKYTIVLGEVKEWEKRENPLLMKVSNISTNLLIDANLQDYIMPMMSSLEKEEIIHHL